MIFYSLADAARVVRDLRGQTLMLCKFYTYLSTRGRSLCAVRDAALVASALLRLDNLASTLPARYAIISAGSEHRFASTAC